jgi:hypothetical protein
MMAISGLEPPVAIHPKLATHEGERMASPRGIYLIRLQSNVPYVLHTLVGSRQAHTYLFGRRFKSK